MQQDSVLIFRYLSEAVTVAQVKNLPAMQRCNPRVGQIPGEENGNPLQYSCLENPIDRRAWWAAVHGVAKSQTGLKQLSKQASNVTLPYCTLVHSLTLLSWALGFYVALKETHDILHDFLGEVAAYIEMLETVKSNKTWFKYLLQMLLVLNLQFSSVQSLSRVRLFATP